KVAPACSLGLGGGYAHRVPFAFTALRPLRADARARDAPGAGRLRGARPVGKVAFHAIEPLRLKPQIDRRLVRCVGLGGDDEECDTEQGRAYHFQPPRSLKPGDHPEPMQDKQAPSRCNAYIEGMTLAEPDASARDKAIPR